MGSVTRRGGRPAGHLRADLRPPPRQDSVVKWCCAVEKRWLPRTFKALSGLGRGRDRRDSAVLRRGQGGVGAKSAWEPPFPVKFSGQGRHPGAPDGVGEQTEQAEETARPVNRSRCGAGMGVLAVRWAGWGWSLVPGLGSGGGARGVRVPRPWRRHRRSRGAAASWGRRWRALNQVAAGTRGASAPGLGPPPGKRVGDPHHGRYRRGAPGGPAGSRPCGRSRARSPLGRSSLEGAATLRATPLPGQGPGPARDRSDRPHSVALTPPHPARRPRDQRHDLAGTTGHRPANQLTRQRIDRRSLDGTGTSTQSQTPAPGKHRGLLPTSAPRPPHSRQRPTRSHTPGPGPQAIRPHPHTV